MVNPTDSLLIYLFIIVVYISKKQCSYTMLVHQKNKQPGMKGFIKNGLDKPSINSISHYEDRNPVIMPKI